jgi:outer membrane receptor protein involved in Fe transport
MKKTLLAYVAYSLFLPSYASAKETVDNRTGGAVYGSFSNLMPVSKLVDDLSLDQLANLVVTESKVAQSQESVTQKIVVQHSDQMELLTNYNRNIAELMRYTSGQFVNVLSRNDANWGSYAGLGPKYNSYMLDGLPIDSFTDGMSLDPWAFERVEAHKGPASVLYSNYLAMDFPSQAPLTGTTNFIVKDQVEAPMTRLMAGGGSFNTYNARVYHQGRAGNLSYLGGASYEYSDYRQYGTAGSWLQAINNPDYQKYKIYGKASYAFGRDDHRLSLFVNYTGHDGNVGRPNRDFDNRYETVNLAYNNQLTKDWHLQIKTGLRDYRRRFGEDNFSSTMPDLSLKNHGVVKQTVIPLDVTLNYAHGQNNLLTMGVDGQWVDYSTKTQNPNGSTNYDNDASGNSKGIFFQEKVQFDKLVLRGGARYNTIEQNYKLLGGNKPIIDKAIWSDWLWSAGFRYNFAKNFSLFGNSGTSFMVPTAKQVGGTLVNPLVDSGQRANPDLKPEKGLGIDTGIDWQPVDGLELTVRLFHNKVSKAIVENVVSNTPSQTMAINTGSAVSKGVEFDIKHNYSDNLYWFSNITYSKTKVKDPKADQNGTQIPFAPNYIANVGLTAQLPWEISVSPYYQWVGHYYDSTSKTSRNKFGNYGVLNMRLQKNIQRNAERSLNLIVDLNNLTDRRYKTLWDFQDTGINVFAGLQLVF